MKKVGLFLMSQKGFMALKAIIDYNLYHLVSFVVYGEDNSIEHDCSEEIQGLCEANSIECVNKKAYSEKSTDKTDMLIAISWRWLIPVDGTQEIIVLHDSILPRYRGFAPLVSALINGEPEVGVTALYASSEYDCGDIIGQSKLKIDYPIKIADAINQITICYNELVTQILTSIEEGKELPRKRQNEIEATYSLWLDEEDYMIDWSLDAAKIKRKVDATGYPYKSALTKFNDKRLRIKDVEILEDVIVENRTPGKIIFTKQGKPVVVCGKGLIKINDASFDGLSESALPLKKFRIRFS